MHPRTQPGARCVHERLDCGERDDASKSEKRRRPDDARGPWGQRDEKELLATEFKLPVQLSSPLSLHISRMTSATSFSPRR